MSSIKVPTNMQNIWQESVGGFLQDSHLTWDGGSRGRDRKWVGVGLGLLLLSCGKIPCTFSPTPTCNTWMEEGRRAKQEEEEGYEGEKRVAIRKTVERIEKTVLKWYESRRLSYSLLSPLHFIYSLSFPSLPIIIYPIPRLSVYLLRFFFLPLY